MRVKLEPDNIYWQKVYLLILGIIFGLNTNFYLVFLIFKFEIKFSFKKLNNKSKTKKFIKTVMKSKKFQE